jgi:hypothetical protein
MKTDVINVSSRGSRMETALHQADFVAEYKGLSRKNALHLRLLTEEMMGIIRSITGETEGEFWIEDNDDVFQLHLRVNTTMDSEKRERLLSTSSSGKNESARGFMGRLRNFFDVEADADVAASAGPLFSAMYSDSSTGSALDYEWSLLRYQEQLNSRGENDPIAREAWDELEKSVVAHVADDVKISIRGRTVEMTIVKKMA